MEMHFPPEVIFLLDFNLKYLKELGSFDLVPGCLVS